MLNEKTSNAEASGVDLAADIAKLRDDVAKLSASVSELLHQQATETQDRVRGAVESARDQLAQSASDARESVRSASAELEASIERNPLTSVIVALLCGLVLGMIGRGHR